MAALVLERHRPVQRDRQVAVVAHRPLALTLLQMLAATVALAPRLVFLARLLPTLVAEVEAALQRELEARGAAQPQAVIQRLQMPRQTLEAAAAECAQHRDSAVLAAPA